MLLENRVAAGTSVQSGRAFVSALKGADAAKAGVLVQAAARAQCAAISGLFTLASWRRRTDYDEHSTRRRWSRYRDYEDDEEEETEIEDQKGAEFTPSLSTIRGNTLMTGETLRMRR